MDYERFRRYEKLAMRTFWAFIIGYIICVIVAVYLMGVVGLVIVVAPLTLFAFWSRYHAELEYIEGELEYTEGEDEFKEDDKSERDD